MKALARINLHTEETMRYQYFYIPERTGTTIETDTHSECLEQRANTKSWCTKIRPNGYLYARPTGFYDSEELLCVRSLHMNRKITSERAIRAFGITAVRNIRY